MYIACGNPVITFIKHIRWTPIGVHRAQWTYNVDLQTSTAPKGLRNCFTHFVYSNRVYLARNMGNAALKYRNELIHMVINVLMYYEF